MDPKTRLDDSKREVHPALRKILEQDVILTKKFVSFLMNFMSIQSFKRHCQFLEISCHGVVWLAGWLALAWFLDNKDLYQMQINMIIGLVLDIIFVATIKAFTRRRRPCEDPYSIGPDKFSFPSGHASRAIYILCFFTMLYPISWMFWPPLFAWSFSVCISRLILYRHHILDVAAGVFLGIFEALFLCMIWFDADTTESLMLWLADDRSEQVH